MFRKPFFFLVVGMFLFFAFLASGGVAHATVTGEIDPVKDGTYDSTIWGYAKFGVIQPCSVNDCSIKIKDNNDTTLVYNATAINNRQTFTLSTSTAEWTNIPVGNIISAIDITFSANAVVDLNSLCGMGSNPTIITYPTVKSVRVLDGAVTDFASTVTMTDTFTSSTQSHSVTYTKGTTSTIEVGLTVPDDGVCDDGDGFQYTNGIDVQLSKIYAKITYAPPPVSVTIGGTVYQDEGTTATSTTVTVVVGGTTSSSTSAGANGIYSVTMVQPATSTIITVYMDNGSATRVGATVTKYSGTNLSGIDVYMGRLITRHEDSGPITNTDLDTYDSANDTDIPFTVTSGILTATSTKIIVWTGKTYRPGGTVNAGAVRVVGTFTPEGNTIALMRGGASGTCTGTLGTVMPLCISGIFTVGTSTINYTGTSSVTIATTTSYYNLGVGTTADSNAVTYTLGGDTTVTNQLTVGNSGSGASDTLAGSTYTFTLSGSETPLNIITSKGTVTTSGSINYTGTSATTIALGNFYWNLGVGTAADANGVTYSAGGDITVANQFTIGASGSSVNDTFSLGGNNLILSGSGIALSSPMQILRGFFTSTAASVVTYSGTSATEITAASSTYYSLALQPSPGSNINYYLGKTSGDSFTINGNFTLGGGSGSVIAIASTYNPTITVAGNLTINSNATFTKGTGTFSFNGSGTRTWTDSTAGQDIGIVTIDQGTVQLGSSVRAQKITVSGTSITLNGNGQNTITLTGTGAVFTGFGNGDIAGGSFTYSNSTVEYIGTGATVTVNSDPIYWNVLVGSSTATNTYSLSGINDAIVKNRLLIATSTGTNTFQTASRSITLSQGGITPFVIPASEIFLAGNSTVSYTGSGSVTVASTTYANLTLNNSGGTFTPANAIAVLSTLAVTAGTLAGTSSITVTGGVVSGNGTINLTGGTFTLSGTGNFGGTSDWIFSNFTLGDGTVKTTTATSTGGITVTGALTLNASHTLSAGTKTWTLSGTTGTPFSLSGTLQGATSTFQFTGNNGAGNTTVPAAYSGSSFYNLTLNNASENFVAAGTSTIVNNLQITAGTWTTPTSKTVTIGGNYINNGTLSSDGTTAFIFNASSTGKVIHPGAWAGVGSSGQFKSVSFEGTGGGWSFATDTIYIQGNLTMKAGTLDNSNGTSTIWVAGNVACSGTCGTINFTSSDHTFKIYNTSAIYWGASSTDWTFSNVTINCDGCGGPGEYQVSPPSGTGNINVLKTLTVASDSALNLNGRTITLFGTGTPLSLGALTSLITTSRGKVVYAGVSATTTIASATYYNLDIGSSTATTTYVFGGDVDVSNILTMNGSSGTNTLSASSSILTLASSGTPFVINESPVSAAFSAGTGTVTYMGSTTTLITAATYNNLDVKPGGTGAHQFAAGTISIGATFTAGDGTHTGMVDASPNSTTLSVTGNVIIATSSSFKANAANTFSVGGNYTNYGTLVHNTGQFTFNGTSQQTLLGNLSGSSAFGRLVFSNNSGTLSSPSILLSTSTETAATSTIVTASTTVQFAASRTYTFNSLNWNGQATTSRVGLRSSIGGTQWLLNVSGAKSVQYANVQDSNACGSSVHIPVGNDSIDPAANNPCWDWPLPGTPGTPTFPYIYATSVVVNWTSATDATYYNLYRSLNSGGPYVFTASTTLTSSTDTGLSGGTTYWYEVVGANGTGPGPTSTAASVTTLTVAGGYATSASLTSVIYDTAALGGVAPNSITWKGPARPAGTTVKFQIAGSNSTSGPWTYTAWNGSGSNDPSIACDASSYYPLAGTSEPNTPVEIKAVCQQNKRYLRYKLFMLTDSSSTTPTINDIILNYAR